MANYPEPGLDIITKCKHFKGVDIDDTDIKLERPIDLILEASEYAKIKKKISTKCGKPDEPTEEFTSIGSTIMYPGADTNLSSVYLTRSSSPDYELLCSLYVLGPKDKPAGDKQVVYTNSKSNWCATLRGSTRLGYCGKLTIHPSLTHTKAVSQLSNLVKKFQKLPSQLHQYRRPTERSER